MKKSEIDDPTEVNANCYVENARLGAEVQVGPNAAIVGVAHNLDDDGVTFREDVFEAVVGAGATVLPGVTIREDAVIGAGEAVTDDVPTGSVYRGDP